MARISQEKEKQIHELYDQDLSVSEISKRTGVPRSTVYSKTKLLDRINPETGAPYTSSTEYLNQQATGKINPDTGKWFKTRQEYDNWLRFNKDNGEGGDYLTHVLHLKNTKYDRKKARQEAAETYGMWISLGLTDIERDQIWLAKQIGVSGQSITNYVQGNAFPDKEVREKINAIFNFDSTTIDNWL